MTGLFSPLLERAFRVAARAHREQCRKSGDLPYFSHPAAVTLILARAGIDADEILAAAVLHDVVEDTPVTLDDLASQFPAEVLVWVADASERKQDANGAARPWIDRKREHLEHLAHVAWPSQAILLADKCHNLRAMLVDYEVVGDEFWTRFNASPERILWYYRAVFRTVTPLRPELARLREFGESLLDELIDRSGRVPAEE